MLVGGFIAGSFFYVMQYLLRLSYCVMIWDFYVDCIQNDLNSCFYQGKSYFYILKNNAVPPVATGGHHWVEFLPDHVYCFTPSMEINKGEPLMFTAMPDFLKDFLYSVEIQQVQLNEILILINSNF